MRYKIILTETVEVDIYNFTPLGTILKEYEPLGFTHESTDYNVTDDIMLVTLAKHTVKE